MFAVLVDDDTGEAIGLTPDEATEIWVDPEALAVGDGLADSAGKEFLVKLLEAAGNSSSDNLGIWIVDAAAQGAVLEILEGDEVSWLWISKSFLDIGRVNPFVAVENPGAGFDNETCHGQRKGHEYWNIKNCATFSLDHSGRTT